MVRIGRGMMLCAALVIGAQSRPAAAQERIPSNCFALAQAPVERVWRASIGSALETGHVRIHYLDHASFAIETEDGTLAVTDYTGYIGNPDVVPDVVTMNNAHSTHWTSNPDPRIPHVLKGWPEEGQPAFHELDLGSMLVRNVTTDTRGPFGEGARADGNSIFVFEAGGLCIGHLGHLHQIPDDAPPHGMIHHHLRFLGREPHSKKGGIGLKTGRVPAQPGHHQGSRTHPDRDERHEGEDEECDDGSHKR